MTQANTPLDFGRRCPEDVESKFERASNEAR